MKRLAWALAAVPLTLLLRGSNTPPRPKILGVAHMAFYVSDLQKARAFWTDFLGYQECFHLNKKGEDTARIAFIKINDYQYIELFNEPPRARQMLNHISIYTEIADAMRDYLAAQGVKVPETVAKGQTGNKNYTIADPDGNPVEIVEYQPDSWTAREKGKFMPDTRISTHMAHAGMFIGPLDRAMAFYHGILGFEEIWRGGGNPKSLSWVNMRVPDGNDYLEMMLYSKMPEPKDRGTKNHLCLVVPDCNRAAETLKARPAYAAYREYAEPIEVKVGVNRKRQANLYDPDRSRIEIMEPDSIDGKPTPSSTAPPPQVEKLQVPK